MTKLTSLRTDKRVLGVMLANACHAANGSEMESRRTRALALHADIAEIDKAIEIELERMLNEEPVFADDNNPF